MAMQKSFQERVFHIDDECYIVYIGTDADDYRPFLRVGTSKNLPDRVRSFISWVILSGTFTGNPFLEHDNVQLPLDGETKYAGEKELVSRLKRLLDEKNLPVAKVVYRVEEEKDGIGSFVYFHKDGDIHVTYHAGKIFDLRDRESDDLHFVYRAETATKQVRSNPFRYLRGAFSSPGFVFAGGELYFAASSGLGCFRVSPDYAIDLAMAGIDPDLLSWVAGDSLTQGILHRFKRGARHKEDMTVFSAVPQTFEKAVQLFAGKGLKCTLRHLAVGSVVAHGALRFAIDRGQVRVHKDAEEAPFAIVDLLTGEARIAAERLPPDFTPISGVPYRFVAEGLTSQLIADRYLDHRDFEDFLPSETRSAYAKLRTAVEEHLSSRKRRQEDAVAELEACASLCRSPEAFILLWNATELVRFLSTQTQDQPRLAKRIAKTLDVLAEARKLILPPGHWPTLGEIFTLRSGIFLLYSCPQLLTKQKEMQARRCRETVERLYLPDREAYFAGERKRLFELIDGLTVPKLKATERAPEPEETAPSEAPVAEPLAAAEPPAAAAAERVRPRPADGRVRTPLVIAIAAGVLLTALALVLLFDPFRWGPTPPVTTTQQVDSTEADPAEAVDVMTQPAAAAVPTPPISQPPADASIPAGVVPEATPEVAKTLTGDEFPIGILDVYLLVNRVARANNYRELDTPAELGRDPNWIYPGNRFTMPTGETYLVKREDTLWAITTSFIRVETRKQLAELRRVLQSYPKDRENSIIAIENLSNLSYVESLRSYLAALARRIKEE